MLCDRELFVRLEVALLQPNDGLRDLLGHGVRDGSAWIRGLYLGLLKRVGTLALNGLDHLGDPSFEGGALRLGAGADETDQTLEIDEVKSRCHSLPAGTLRP